jgi:hypothetical protein
LNLKDKKKNNPVTAYHEKQIGKNIYRVTSVYMGQFELGKALEELIVKKILRDENNPGEGIINYGKTKGL